MGPIPMPEYVTPEAVDRDILVGECCSYEHRCVDCGAFGWNWGGVILGSGEYKTLCPSCGGCDTERLEA